MSLPLSDTQSPSPVLRDESNPLRNSVRVAVENYLGSVEVKQLSDFYDTVLAEVEAPLLEAVMQKVRYNQSKAARLLGLNRGTLRTKLRRYNLLD